MASPRREQSDLAPGTLTMWFIEYTHLGFASASAVPLESEGDPDFSLLTHTKQLCLVTFCYTTAGNGASFWTHERTNGWTDRRGSRNSYLDESQIFVISL